MAIDAVFESGPALLSSQWDFKVYLDNLTNVMSTDEFAYRIRSVNLPTMNLSHETHPTGLKFYSGVEHIESLSIEVEERFDFAVYDVLLALRGAVYDEQNRVFRQLTRTSLPNATLSFYSGPVRSEYWDDAADSEKDLREEDAKNIVRQFTFEKLRILTVDELSLTHEDSTPVQYSVTFAVENVKMEQN